MGKTTTRKSWLADLKPLKLISESTKLPYVFDLHWDIKTGEDLLKYTNYGVFPEICRFLAEHGYNVEAWKEYARKHEIQKTVNVIDYFGSFIACSGTILPGYGFSRNNSGGSG